MLTRVGPTAAGLLVALAVAPVQAAPAHAADDDCSTIAPDDRPTRTTERSRPLDLMHVDDAFDEFDRRGKVPGKGVSVAVVDNGVYSASDLLTVAPEGFDATGGGPLLDYHGTAVAGLIAGHEREDGGPIGIAPGATIVDVRVYETDQPTDDTQMEIDTPNVVDGLRWVAQEAKRNESLKVVNLSLDVDHNRALKKAVKKVLKQDVVVVAASGNRPGEGEPDHATLGTYVPGEDVAGQIHPAAYPGVIAVSATTDGMPIEEGPYDPRSFVLQSSDTDVAAPTRDAVTIGVNGSTCPLNLTPATSWAAAEVSGVVAMLRSWYPEESAGQIVARLVTTADGVDVETAEARSVLTGAGVVQPHEALVRRLTANHDGSVVSAQDEERSVSPAVAPPPEADPLGSMRNDAVWWGLISGGAIVLTLLMRPIMTRLRRG